MSAFPGGSSWVDQGSVIKNSKRILLEVASLEEKSQTKQKATEPGNNEQTQKELGNVLGVSATFFKQL